MQMLRQQHETERLVKQVSLIFHLIMQGDLKFPMTKASVAREGWGS